MESLHLPADGNRPNLNRKINTIVLCNMFADVVSANIYELRVENESNYFPQSHEVEQDKTTPTTLGSTGSARVDNRRAAEKKAAARQTEADQSLMLSYQLQFPGRKNPVIGASKTFTTSWTGQKNVNTSATKSLSSERTLAVLESARYQKQVR